MCYCPVTRTDLISVCYSVLRKAHRKNVPLPVSTARSPSLATASIPYYSSSSSRNKPRELADALLVSAAFLATDPLAPVHGVALSHSNGHVTESDGGHSPRHRQRSLSASADGAKAPKKRSTMNSRDAAYDDAIAASLMVPGTATIRSRGDKGGREGSVGAEEESGEEVTQLKRSASRDTKVEYHEVDESGARLVGRDKKKKVWPAAPIAKKRRQFEDARSGDADETMEEDRDGGADDSFERDSHLEAPHHDGEEYDEDDSAFPFHS
mgnify:CR=1 FL=1